MAKVWKAGTGESHREAYLRWEKEDAAQQHATWERASEDFKRWLVSVPHRVKQAALRSGSATFDEIRSKTLADLLALRQCGPDTCRLLITMLRIRPDVRPDITATIGDLVDSKPRS